MAAPGDGRVEVVPAKCTDRPPARHYPLGMVPKIIIGVLLALILGVPFVLRPAQTRSKTAVGPTATLVIVTPHVPQIQFEFAAGFERWYARTYQEQVRIDWRQPGGTGDIIKQLSAQYASRCAEVIEEWRSSSPERLRNPDLDLTDAFPPGTVAFDLMMGGGSFDHSRLRNPNTGAYWFKPYDGQGERRVRVTARGVLDAATVALERQIIAYVQADPASADAPILVRIPIGAIVGPGGAMEALVPLIAASKLEQVKHDTSKQDSGESSASGPGTVELTLNLSLLERQASVSISMPAGFSQAELTAWYGENALGSGLLYDPEQYWLGTAISGFGIVFNRDVLKDLGLPEPVSFEDLADGRLAGWVVFADPRQSGSVATTIDAILSYYGWEKGWRLLREMCANTRYYTNSAPRPPMDVSQGEAAAGLCIDFYGRSQSQSVLLAGQSADESRVGYVDPKGATYMDADPISLLRGGPNPALAKRFIEFVLSEEGQALWQFPALSHSGATTNPPLAGGTNGERMGPQRSELRRMPVRRVMYEKYYDHLVDKVNPFEVASPTKPAGWRDTIGVMMGAFAIETADDQYAAWAALRAARADPSFAPAQLAEMDSLFHSWPTTIMPDGAELAFEPRHVKAITTAWKDGTFKSACEVRYLRFFQSNYRRIVAIYKAQPSEAAAGKPGG